MSDLHDPLSIQVNADGQVWIRANATNGRSCLVNLNNIFLEMHREGISRGICLEALELALRDQNKGIDL